LNLSIIVPAYNEGKTLEQVLDALSVLELPECVASFEVVVVDDASADNTQAVGHQYVAAPNRPVKVVVHPQNSGKGAAVRTGVEHASGDVILVQDADMELHPMDIPRLLEAMQLTNLPFINGSRYMPGPIRPVFGFWRYYFNRLFTMLTSLIINARLTDMACGYKLIRKDLFQSLALKEERFGFEAELIIKALRLEKRQVAEVPVHYFPRNVQEGKKLRNSDGLRIFWVILKYGLFRRW